MNIILRNFVDCADYDKCLKWHNSTTKSYPFNCNKCNDYKPTKKHKHEKQNDNLK